MALKAITHVLDHAPEDIKPAKMLLLMILADSAGGDDWSCYPSTRYLSRKARMDQRYAKQLLSELADERLIEIDRFGGMKTASGFTNRYYVLVDGARFSDANEPQHTRVNHSAPHGVYRGSPKPLVEPVEEKSVLPTDDLPDFVAPAKRKVLAIPAPQPDGGALAYSLIDAWLDAWDITGRRYRDAAHRSHVKAANYLADMQATPEDITAFVKEKRAQGKQPDEWPLQFIANNFVGWKHRSTEPKNAAASGIWRELDV